MNASQAPRLSVPARVRVPRPLDERERLTLAAIADSLIPAASVPSTPSATGEPDFWQKVDIALDARADAFDTITRVLGELVAVPSDAMFGTLERLDAEDPAAFQAISTVVAGAWLLTAGTRDRIGYHGPQSVKAGLEEVADEIASGILDPVLERYADRSGT